MNIAQSRRSVYEGQWMEGKRHGKGKWVTASKEMYQVTASVRR